MEEKVPQPDFYSLVNFFALIALQHLGLVKNPITDKVEKNLELAKYTIDTLDLIKEKTKGNLTEDEERFLDNIIADLKMNYVRIKNEESANPPPS